MKYLKFSIACLFAAVLAIIGGKVMGNIFNIDPLIPGSLFFTAGLLPVRRKGVLAINIFSAPGGIAAPFNFNLNYLPQFLSFVNTVPLTSLKVETAEDGVLHDWTAAGLVAMANFLQVGAMTANVLQFRLADGEIRPKNVTISGITSAAGVVPFFVSSDHRGSVAYRSKNAAILAANPTSFDRFTALFIPTMATGSDRAEITFKDGQQQTFAMEDLRNLSAIYQESVGVIINNINAYMTRVIVTCAALTPAYVLSVNIPQ